MKYAIYIAISVILSMTALIYKFGWRDVINIVGPALTMWAAVAIVAAVLTGFSWQQIKWRWFK